MSSAGAIQGQEADVIDFFPAQYRRFPHGVFEDAPHETVFAVGAQDGSGNLFVCSPASELVLQKTLEFSNDGHPVGFGFRLIRKLG